MLDAAKTIGLIWVAMILTYGIITIALPEGVLCLKLYCLLGSSAGLTYVIVAGP